MYRGGYFGQFWRRTYLVLSWLSGQNRVGRKIFQSQTRKDRENTAMAQQQGSIYGFFQFRTLRRRPDTAGSGFYACLGIEDRGKSLSGQACAIYRYCIYLVFGVVNVEAFNCLAVGAGKRNMLNSRHTYSCPPDDFLFDK